MLRRSRACARPSSSAFPGDRPFVSRALRAPLSVGAGAMWLCSTAPALAQDRAPTEAVEMETVTLIGTTPLPGLGVPKERVPANVQSATSADVDRAKAIDLTGFMNRRLGSVYVNEIQNNPLQPDLNFRGYTASPLLGTQQGLSLYMDGVRLNQPFGDVVSWDLIPRSAIASMALMPGSNPLFGLNTLGGALSIQTKDGFTNPGTSVQGIVGMHKRWAVEFEHGGNVASGLNWFVTGNKFKEDGWRNDSPSDVTQVFGKFGVRSGRSQAALSVSLVRTDLNGNGLQEQRFLERDYASVYTKPDNTKNKAGLLNLSFLQGLTDTLSVSGNAYFRSIYTKTFNGDINDDSFDQALYQPNLAERNALAAAGYTGFPVAGETAANTPFPFWRCIANALLVDEPAEKCNGVINRTRTNQRNYGLSAQLNHDAHFGAVGAQSLVGAAVDIARSRFEQGSELGYLNPDRSITGVGAFGDGGTGGDVDGEPYDTRVDLTGRTRTYSLYASSIVGLTSTTYLTVSGRYNRVTVKNRDAILPGGGTGSLDADVTYSRFNPALGLTFSPVAGLNAYVGANQGSRAPSSVELGCADPESPCKLPNAFAGDPPLKQVVTTTLEAGVRGGNPSSWTWNAGVFRSDNRDDLLFVSSDVTGFGYFKNFGKTRRQGLELGGTVQATQGFSVGANYTWLDATFRSAEVVDGSSNSANASAADGFPGVEGTIDIRPGDRIPLVPRHMFKAFADLQLGERWSVGLDMLALGDSIARGNENGRHQADDVYYLGPGRVGGYAIFNFTTEFRPTTGLKVFAQVNNLFNRKYSTAAQLGPTGFNDAGNFEARPFPPDTNGDRPLRHATFYAPGAPLTVWGGVRYTFAN